MYKRVEIQFVVPDGDYCREFTGDKSVCEHSTEYGGRASCRILFGENLVRIAGQGIKKPERCLSGKFISSEKQDKENELLRELLWLRHGCKIMGLYGDDGERQCGTCMIDFKRDSPQLIKEKWETIGKKKLEKYLMEEEKDDSS